jgi:hypothetical protein
MSSSSRLSAIAVRKDSISGDWKAKRMICSPDSSEPLGPELEVAEEEAGWD